MLQLHILGGALLLLPLSLALTQLVPPSVTSIDYVQVVSTLAFIACPAYLLLSVVSKEKAPRKDTAGNIDVPSPRQSLPKRKEFIDDTDFPAMPDAEAMPSSARQCCCDFTELFVPLMATLGFPAPRENPAGEQRSEPKGMPPDSFNDWWDHADVTAVPGLRSLPSMTKLINCDLIHHPDLSKPPSWQPWSLGESSDIYSRLGASDPTSAYVALWMNVGASSLLSVGQVLNKQAFEACFCEDFPLRNLKLLLQPVRIGLPFPAKRASHADTIANFFGCGASCHRSHASDAIDLAVIQVDLYSVWSIRMALKAAGYKTGNEIDIIVVDWPGQTVLLSVRLVMTGSVASIVK